MNSESGRLSRMVRVATNVTYAVAAVLVALAIRDRWDSGIGPPPERLTAVAQRSLSPELYALGLKGNRRGPDDADVTIVVFSSYGCSHCASFERTLSALLRRFPDQLAVVTKHFEPSAPRVTVQTAAAADCAASQGEFEAYHQSYFRDPPRGVSREPWREIIRRIAVPDTMALIHCVRAGVYDHTVAEQTAQGYAVGVTGTPTTFVNGVRVVGDAPYTGMERLISRLLRDRAGGGDGPTGPMSALTAKVH